MLELRNHLGLRAARSRDRTRRAARGAVCAYVELARARRSVRAELARAKDLTESLLFYRRSWFLVVLPQPAYETAEAPTSVGQLPYAR